MIPNFAMKSLLCLHNHMTHHCTLGWLGDSMRYGFYVALVFSCLVKIF